MGRPAWSLTPPAWRRIFPNLFLNRIHIQHLQAISCTHLSQAEEQMSGLDFIKSVRDNRKLGFIPFTQFSLLPLTYSLCFLYFYCHSKTADSADINIDTRQF